MLLRRFQTLHHAGHELLTPLMPHTPHASHPTCHTPSCHTCPPWVKTWPKFPQWMQSRREDSSFSSSCLTGNLVPHTTCLIPSWWRNSTSPLQTEGPAYTAKPSYPTTCMGTWMFSQTRPHPSRPGSWDRITRYVSMWRSQCCRSVSPFLSCFPFRNICRLKAWKYTTKSLTAGSETFLRKCQKLELRKSVTANLGCQIDWIYNQLNENQLSVSVRDCLDQFNWNLKDRPKGGRWGKRKYKRERPVVFILCWQAHLLGWHLAVGAAAAAAAVNTAAFFSLTLEPSFIGPPR